MAVIASIRTPHAAPVGAAPYLAGALRLMRPANLVTSAADILAAAVITGAPARRFSWLVAASVCLYAGGVTLNDFFDRQLDSIERPERPIPSGVIAPSVAAIVGTGLLLVGILFAFMVSLRSGIVAALLATTVLAYNAWAKRNSAGPFLMGSCRALNLLLGLSAVPAVMAHLWPLTLLPFVYIVAITSLSRGEVHGGSRATSGITLLLVSLVLLSLLAASLVSAWPHPLALLVSLAFLSLRVGPPLWRAWQQPTAVAIRTGVHAGVVSLIALDACLAAAFGGIVEGGAVLSLSVLSAELSRFFAVT